MNQQQSLEFATKYLEDLLSFYGVNVSVESDIVDGFIELKVPVNEDASILIGRNAETLRSIQYLVRTTLRNHEAEIDRVNLDIADYKKQRAEKIVDQARGWIEEVRKTGDSHVARLNAADRRVVHQLVTEYDDVRTFSEGEGRDRVLIIAQKSS